MGAEVGRFERFVLAFLFLFSLDSNFLEFFRFHRGHGLFLLATCCGNRVLYAESSKLGKLTSEILNDLQLIVRSYKYLNICIPPLKMNG